AAGRPDDLRDFPAAHERQVVHVEFALTAEPDLVVALHAVPRNRTRGRYFEFHVCLTLRKPYWVVEDVEFVDSRGGGSMPATLPPSGFGSIHSITTRTHLGWIARSRSPEIRRSQPSAASRRTPPTVIIRRKFRRARPWGQSFRVAVRSPRT